MVKQRDYSKREFAKFLNKYSVNDEMISDFNTIPETLNVNGEVFVLKIQTRWYNVGNTYHEFEFNYYSEKIIEFLFGFKVFTNVEISINYLLCELKRDGHLDHNKKNDY